MKADCWVRHEALQTCMRIAEVAARSPTLQHHDEVPCIVWLKWLSASEGLPTLRNLPTACWLHHILVGYDTAADFERPFDIVEALPAM